MWVCVGMQGSGVQHPMDLQTGRRGEMCVGVGVGVFWRAGGSSAPHAQACRRRHKVMLCACL